jgi:hypothetical protein
MVNKRARSFTSTSSWKARYGCWAPSFPVLSISRRRDEAYFGTKECAGAPQITDSPSKELYWEPTQSLYTGLELTYQRIEQQVGRDSPYSATTQSRELYSIQKHPPAQALQALCFPSSYPTPQAV